MRAVITMMCGLLPPLGETQPLSERVVRTSYNDLRSTSSAACLHIRIKSATLPDKHLSDQRVSMLCGMVLISPQWLMLMLGRRAETGWWTHWHWSWPGSADALDALNTDTVDTVDALTGVTGDSDSVSGPRRQTRKQPGPGLVLGKCLVSGEHLNNGDIWQRSGFW